MKLIKFQENYQYQSIQKQHFLDLFHFYDNIFLQNNLLIENKYYYFLFFI